MVNRQYEGLRHGDVPVRPMTHGNVCKLALEDGLVFAGVSFGAEGTAQGEVVFNTSMTGYQEALTDPSYAGQVLTMTYPLIGNYGINEEDVESHNRRIQVAGFVIKELSPIASSFRATHVLVGGRVVHEDGGAR